MSTYRIMNRRKFLQAAAAAGVGLVGAIACKPATSPSAPTESPTVAASKEATAPAKATAVPEAITLAFVCDVINEGHEQVLDAWVKAFSEEFSNVTVDHQPVPYQDYKVKVQTLFAAGTPPDVYRYLPAFTPIVIVATKNMHLRLDDLVDKDDYDLSDFRKDALALYRWEGALYALPRDYGNQNLFINLDLFAKAGIELPPVDWEDKTFTFDKFLDMARSLTIKQGDRTEQWGFLVNRGWRPWASWVYCNGGQVVKCDDKGEATAIALDEAPAVEALQFLQDLMYTYAVAPRPDLESELGGFNLFATGRVGMMINNPSAVNQYRTIEAFKWDIATLPIGKANRRGTGGGGTGWATGAATKHPAAAWEFLKFISSPEAETDEVEVGATTPARISVVTGPKFVDPSKPPARSKGFVQGQEYVVADPVHVRWSEVFSRAVTPNLDLLWNGSKSAADVVKVIKAEGDKLLAGA